MKNTSTTTSTTTVPSTTTIPTTTVKSSKKLKLSAIKEVDEYNPVTFLEMCSFTNALERIYSDGVKVATCKILAQKHMYISTANIFKTDATYGVGIFKVYRKFNKPENCAPKEVVLNQDIFSPVTGWTVYYNLEQMVEDLGW